MCLIIDLTSSSLQLLYIKINNCNIYKRWTKHEKTYRIYKTLPLQSKNTFTIVTKFFHFIFSVHLYILTFP